MSQLPHNDPAISDEDRLIRGITPHHIINDIQGMKRVSSLAFQTSSDTNEGMSVYIEKLVSQGEKDPKEYVKSKGNLGAVVFTAGDARKSDMMVAHTPNQDSDYHGDVWGKKREDKKFTQGQTKKLHRKSKWYIPIPDVKLI